MGRTLTKNSDGELVWTEKAFDVDEDDLSHPLATKVELDAIDGTTQSGDDRTPSWLTATVIEDGVQSGQWEERVKTTITDPGQLSEDTDYTFLYRAADGVAQTDLRRTLSVGALKPEIDGTKLYEIAYDPEKIYESDLSTAWDISTASLKQSIDTEDRIPLDLFFKPDGKKLYQIGRGDDKIYENDLSTAWDIITASLKQSIGTDDQYPNGLFFKPDGTKMYQIGNGANKIYESDLSTAWDISTASLKQSIDTEDISPRGLFFKPDGKKMYEMGADSDKIYESNLSTAWDISTASLKQSIDTESGNPRGIVFGKK